MHQKKTLLQKREGIGSTVCAISDPQSTFQIDRVYQSVVSSFFLILNNSAEGKIEIFREYWRAAIDSNPTGRSNLSAQSGHWEKDILTVILNEQAAVPIDQGEMQA